MSKISNFNEFRINEAEVSPRSKQALIDVFFETLEEVVEDTDMDLSYSTYAQGFSKKDRHLDPVVDFNVMVAQFGRHGWTKKALKNFFDKFGKDVLEIYDNGNSMRGSRGTLGSAGADIFFYYMMKPSNKDFVIAGYDYKDAAKTQGVGEFWIKFGYGYQNTKYGQLVINQQLGSLDAWYELAYTLLQKGLFDEDDSQALGGETLHDTEWDTPKIKSLVKKNTTWDGKTTVTIDLAPVEDNLGDEKFARFLEAFKTQLVTLGFDMGNSDSYRLGGTGTIKRSVIKLSLKK